MKEKAKTGERLLMKTVYNLRAREEQRLFNGADLKYKYTMNRLMTLACWEA